MRIEIDTLRAQRNKKSIQDLPALEDDLAKRTARLDWFYKISLAHLEKMDMVGMDIREASSTMTRLLTERADELSGRIMLSLDRIDNLEVRRKKFPDDADTAKLLVVAAKSLETNTSSMDVMLGLMEKMEMDPKAYRAQLVTATRDISTGLLDTG